MVQQRTTSNHNYTHFNNFITHWSRILRILCGTEVRDFAAWNFHHSHILFIFFSLSLVFHIKTRLTPYGFYDHRKGMCRNQTTEQPTRESACNIFSLPFFFLK
ncbi:hypothetical protein, unlikely [Trypanosoma brucei gambiense DAL972]|uniref:Uncharacterized protein n=1 Tax=Trypanosoma brucei gambiense (strain MHOM/CI/86/DAL972) TaxID=679716 RepID=C9ZRQ3_TRYB9|nr:hypothetical protein, unlikely [Trypanosoma brucei gambiense DAL972]CBH12039.1 hypothetical protein, unlikely [Trypanosoma brucei gambiense DAL972]|eukprot:XP_011774322.1 hypothetical protein, unlikely [Trypanosoma brucei gambiense DAL972]